MKITKRQLRQIIREEKSRILEMQYDDADTLDPRRVSDLLGRINDAVEQLLTIGMDPDSLQAELESIALSVTDLDHYNKGYRDENY